jgi:hypothetical protein
MKKSLFRRVEPHACCFMCGCTCDLTPWSGYGYLGGYTGRLCDTALAALYVWFTVSECMFQFRWSIAQFFIACMLLAAAVLYCWEDASGIESRMSQVELKGGPASSCCFALEGSQCLSAYPARSYLPSIMWCSVCGAQYVVRRLLTFAEDVYSVQQIVWICGDVYRGREM